MRDMPTVAGNGCPFKRKAEFDPLADAFVDNPWDFLKSVQADMPVFYAESIDHWVITRYDHIRACFLNPGEFSASNTLETVTPLSEETMARLDQAGFRPEPSLVNEDGPVHKSRRARLQRQFDLRKADMMEPYVRATVNEHIDRVVKLGKADLMKDIIYDVPLLVAFKVLGLPLEDVRAVKKMGKGLAHFSFGAPNAEQQTQVAEELGKYWNYAAEQLDYKRTHLGDDFISEAIRGQMEDGKDVWSDDYLTFLVLNATSAAHETTTNATGNAVMNLLSQPRLWHELVNDPSKIPNAINEMIRIGPSFIGWRRKAVVDVEIGGVKIPAGSNILMYLGAANRDPAVFDRPDEIDLDRKNATKALSFGMGAHQCLGQSLARLEMRIILEELTRRLPHMRLASRHFSFAPATVMARGPAHILVEWDPAHNPLPGDRP